MGKLVSVVVPVYNAEKCIERCVKSILNQTYSCVEVLCVNDGSTDQSADIIKEIMNIDSRVVIINKANSGVSDTRNSGINISKGSYVMFVDADDYIEKNYIEQMVAALEKTKSELVVSAYTEVKNGIFTKKTTYYNQDDILFDITFPTNLYKFFSTCEFNPCWKQLISKKMLDINSIRFDKNIKYGEDMLFSLACYSKSKKTVYLNNYGYNYLLNEDSVMHRKNIEAMEKYYLDNKKIHDIILHKYQLDKENAENLNFKILRTFNNITTTLVFSKYKYATYSNIVAKFRKIYKEEFSNYRLFSRGKTSENFSLMLLKYNLKLFYFLIKKIKAVVK